MTRYAVELQRRRAGAVETVCDGSFGHWRSPRGPISSRAGRVVAPDLAELEELITRNAESLIDLRRNLDEFVEQRAIGQLHDLGQKNVGDGIAVFIEGDFSGRCLKDELRERRAQLGAAVGDVV